LGSRFPGVITAEDPHCPSPRLLSRALLEVASGEPLIVSDSSIAVKHSQVQFVASLLFYRTLQSRQEPCKVRNAADYIHRPEAVKWWTFLWQINCKTGVYSRQSQCFSQVTKAIIRRSCEPTRGPSEESEIPNFKSQIPTKAQKIQRKSPRRPGLLNCDFGICSRFCAWDLRFPC
jgi:hypothetical protein